MKESGKEVWSEHKTKFENNKQGYLSSTEEEEEIERELAEITFEELQRVKSDGSHLHRNLDEDKRSKRANKNRPMEASCKKPVSRFREVIQVPKKAIRDPRFESLCGELDVERFKKKYHFLYENNIPAEREELQKQLKKTKNPDEIIEIRNKIAWIDKQLKESSKRTDSAILAEHKKKEREAAKQGKRPFYLKKSEIRKQSLVQKYNSLKAAGKLDSFIEKRRKKNAAKDRRYMPYRRTSSQDQQD
ncbi:hypothetical protein SAY87_015228 [Trapa incisa]|uniref:rRNA biogenesis protein RRP36 n=1 Tax=Trapa incisa TaxID=236973 RepID=A0AAN7JL90_9MYRT|nr:hypothetical protein SAY87_015228 [Trapa incisa]